MADKVARQAIPFQPGTNTITVSAIDIRELFTSTTTTVMASQQSGMPPATRAAGYVQASPTR